MGNQRQASKATQKRYERIAPIYNLMEILPETIYMGWRENLWSLVQGPRVLEIGVGTGKNIPYYPADVEVTALDLTPGMLTRAAAKAKNLPVEVDLILGDVELLCFPADTFNTVTASFVFCSVADPIRGLTELLRVTKPGGQALFLEHVRSENRVLGPLMDLVNPLVVHTMGPNINRRTVQHIQRSGFDLIKRQDLGLGDIFKLIVARKP